MASILQPNCSVSFIEEEMDVPSLTILDELFDIKM